MSGPRVGCKRGRKEKEYEMSLIDLKNEWNRWDKAYNNWRKRDGKEYARMDRVKSEVSSESHSEQQGQSLSERGKKNI